MGEHPESVAFTLFGIDVMWYGILIASGMAVAIIISYYRAPKHQMKSDLIINIALVCLPAGVIGARLYYVFFNWDYYSQDLVKILYVRNGGLAIHGGLILAFLAGVVCCRIWRERPLNVLDCVVPSIALAQAIGRWGNYFNGEAHGGPTDLPWAITVDGVNVHPTFLYESIWCFLLFFFLIFTDNRRKFTGQTFLLYCILYSVERFFVEGLRTDSLMLFGVFRQAQVLSFFVIVACVIFYIVLSKRSGHGVLGVKDKDEI